jgi:hypothetical protein
VRAIGCKQNASHRAFAENALERVLARDDVAGTELVDVKSSKGH